MIRLISLLSIVAHTLIIKELMEQTNDESIKYSLGWTDSLNNVFNSQIQCVTSKTGPFLGPIKNNITKIYNSLPPHYYIQISLDLLFFGVWSADDWIQVIIDGNIIFSQNNIQSQEFTGPSNYCLNNEIGNQFTMIITINANMFHSFQNIELQILGNFQCFNTNQCGLIAIKNIHINIQECDQSCLTCSGPLKSNCLTCPVGTPKKGECKCQPQINYQNTCVDSCPIYFYEQAKQCLPDCSKYCLDCQKQLCNQCVPGYYLQNGVCVSKCPNYTIQQGQNCVDIENLSNAIYVGKYFYTQDTLISNEIAQFSFSSKSQNSQLTTQKYSFYQDMFILGGFGTWSDGTYSINIQSIQNHSILYLIMDVYYIDDWLGEQFSISVDNQVIYSLIVDNSNSQQGHQYYMNSNDRKDSLSLFVMHNSSSAKIDFTSTLNKSSFQASLGITNLFILVDNFKISQNVLCQQPYQNVQNFCIICDAKSNRQTNCQCLPGFYEGNNLICSNCPIECQTCLSLNTCLSCSDGYYLEENLGKCSKCQFNCQICQDLNQCLTCKDGYFQQDSSCLMCMTGCLKCSDESSCIVCASNYFMNNQQICQQCESGYFQRGQTCEKCDLKCLTCNQFKCLECVYPRISPPKCDCSDGYFDLNNICKNCSLKCSTCSINETQCLTCSENRVNPPLCDCPIGSSSKLEIGIIKCSFCYQAQLDIKFSNSLDTIIVNFSKPIKLNSSFLCSMIFNQITFSTLGNLPKCYVKENQLNITLGDNPTISVFDSLYFTNTSLSYQECSEAIEQFLGNSVNGPDISVSPIILLNMKILEYPQALQFNIAKKLNHGKRQILIKEWTLDQSKYPDAKVELLIQSLAAQTDKSKYILPYMEFETENTLKFTLTYSNFIGTIGRTDLVINVHPVIDNFRANVTFLRGPYYQNQDFLILFYFYLRSQEDSNTSNNVSVQLTFKQAEDNNFTLEYQLEGQLNQYLEFKQNLANFKTQLQYGITISVRLENQLKLNQTYVLYVDQIKPELIILSNLRNIGYAQILHLNSRLTLGYESNDIQWKCINLESKSQCVDQSKNNQLLTFESSLNITIDPYVFTPYQVLQFQIQVTGDFFIAKTEAIVLVIEEDSPTLKLDINQALYEKQINYYDKVHLKYSYTDTETNPDLLLYTGGFFANNTIIYQQSYKYLEIIFRLWEFTEFLTQEYIDFEFTIFNTNYFMPAKYVFKFKVNQPPQNCQLQANITSGIAIVDTFLISVMNCIDENTPLQYRFVLYVSEQHKNNDYMDSVVHQGIILQDYSYVNQMTIFLSGNDTIIIMAMVKDQMQGISNHTIILQITKNNFTELQYTALLNQYTEISSSKAEKTLQLILLDYIYNQKQNLYQLFFQALSVQSNLNSTQYFNYTVNQLLLQLSIYENQSLKENYIHQQLLNLNRSLQNYYNQLSELWISQNILQYNNEQFIMQRILEDVHFSAEILNNLIFQHNYFIRQDSSRFLQEINEQNNSQLIINQVNQIKEILQIEQVTNHKQQSVLTLQEYSIKTEKISQKILNSEVGNITNVSSQYIISQVSYKINPYYQDLAFKQYTNSEPTSYQELQLKQSNNNQIITDIDNTISYEYAKSQLNQNTLYECAQKTVDSWSNENCLTEITETQIFCKCNKIVATTLIGAAEELVYSLQYIFSLNALQKLGQYNYTTSMFIYLLFFGTTFYFWILFRGNQLDKKQGNEDLSRSKVVPLKALSLTTISDRKTPQLIRSPNLIRNSLHIRSSQNLQFNTMKIEQIDSEAQIMTSKQTSDKEIKQIIFDFDRSIVGQIKNGELVFFQAFLEYLKKFHKISSIYTRYDPKFSRCFRATLLYIAFLGQMSILIFFGRIINLYTIATLTILQGIFSFIFRTILCTSLSSHIKIFQYFGVFLSTNSCILFYYVILVSLTKYETQLQCVFWGLVYLFNLFLIHIVYAPIIQLVLFIILVKFDSSIIKKIFKLLLFKAEYEFFYGKLEDEQETNQ